MKDDMIVQPARKKFMRIFNSNWMVTILGGLILALLTPLATGFVNFTFSVKSWELFGISNEAGTPGSYLDRDSVYKLPVNERFRIDEDFLLSVGRNRYDAKPMATLTADDGRGQTDYIKTSNSLVAENKCYRIAVHLMRLPDEKDTEFFVMYTKKLREKNDCQGFLSRLF